ncbi:uncharacterized [Tachysurus ichikawai]
MQTPSGNCGKPVRKSYPGDETGSFIRHTRQDCSRDNARTPNVGIEFSYPVTSRPRGKIRKQEPKSVIRYHGSGTSPP